MLQSRGMRRLWAIGFSTFLGLAGVTGNAKVVMASEISVYCAMEPFQGNPDGGAAEDWVCAAMLQEVAAAHPEARVHMARAIDDADVVLDTRVGPGFVARVVWQGQPAGNWTGTALRGREIGAQEVAVLIRTLLQTNPKP